MLGMHLKRISKWEIWVWICFQHFIQGNFCWWTTTVCLWRVTPSKLFRRRPKSGGNCKYTTFPRTHAPNPSGQQESFRRGETRPQFHFFRPTGLQHYPLCWNLSSGTFLFWNLLFGNFHFWHDIYGAQLVTLHENLKIKSDSLQIFLLNY